MYESSRGSLWDTEKGGTRMDEVNLVEPGSNSGWRQVMGLSSLKEGFDPDRLVSFEGKGEYDDPELVLSPSVGLTALKFLSSDNYGQQYQNDMFVSDFHNGNIYHFDLNEVRTGLALTGDLKDKIADNRDELEDIIFGEGFGGITGMEVGPDGNLYVLSLHQGGDNCTPSKTSSDRDCIEYHSGARGVIFRIITR